MTVSKRAMGMAERLFDLNRGPGRWPGIVHIAEAIQTVLDEKHTHMRPQIPPHPDELRPPETFERTVWVNVYPRHKSDEQGGCTFFPSKAVADSTAAGSRIACLCLTIKGTVGEGLEK